MAKKTYSFTDKQGGGEPVYVQAKDEEAARARYSKDYPNPPSLLEFREIDELPDGATALSDSDKTDDK